MKIIIYLTFLSFLLIPSANSQFVQKDTRGIDAAKMRNVMSLMADAKRESRVISYLSRKYFWSNNTWPKTLRQLKDYAKNDTSLIRLCDALSSDLNVSFSKAVKDSVNVTFTPRDTTILKFRMSYWIKSAVDTAASRKK